jgi:hypothetical protein
MPKALSICLARADWSLTFGAEFVGDTNLDHGRQTTVKLGELLRRRKLLTMSGGFNPLHAQMSEVLGHGAFLHVRIAGVRLVYGIQGGSFDDAVQRSVAYVE